MPAPTPLSIRLRNERQDTHRSWDACNEANEEGDYTGLLEDGLGHDDDDEEDGEDDPDPNSLPEQGSTKPSRPIRPLSEWLESQFKARLADASERVDGLPALYRVAKTFWFPVTIAEIAGRRARILVV
ncbi:hypothetical protein R3P38DRAFT_2806311 [Favolaschia claudopus]|uniref:Uncharacterized protein n=1 Tax=Favolaschia claudopus TaxID=2862362 RepID=A0AAV9ZKB9_9AGAR